QDHRFGAEDPADVPGPGADGTQDGDLAGAFEDVRAQGADQAHEHDGHHHQAQDLDGGEDGLLRRGDLRVYDVDLLGADRVSGGGQPGGNGGSHPVDGGVARAGGADPDRVRGAGPAIEALQNRQREVDGVAVIGGDGVDPDDADPGRPRGDGER